MRFVDDILNRVTMYRVVLYYLAALVLIAALFGTLGILPYAPVPLLFTTGAFIAACLVANAFFAWAFDAVPGTDSSLITALILILIVNPVQPTDFSGMVFIGFISVWAIGSKYVLALARKHVFNPAAFGVALAALVVGQGATWWVAGNLPMLPFVVIGGLLIVRKIQRFDLVLSFGAAALLTVALTSLTDPLANLLTTLEHSSFFFLAFVMLTEPATMPPSRPLRMLYGAIAGVLFAPAVHLLSFYFTPETALLAANVFAFVVSPKGRYKLRLTARHKLASGVYEFVFASDRPLTFRAGQYLEWTLPGKGSDTRGNRRYFTIASAPSEREVRIGIKFYTPTSSFKRELSQLQLGGTIWAAQVAGDFVLPKSKKKKLAFIAGGIGVTPFRSMVGEMLSTGEKRDAVLLYGTRREEDIAYRDVFDAAQLELGMKTVYAVTEPAPGALERPRLIDPALIRREIPDYRERIFYISGPRSMVVSFEESLRLLGLRSSQIRTDYFPGFV